MIHYDSENGIVLLQEGHFSKGKHDSFGRFMNKESTGNEYFFIGWFPSEEEEGKGISVVEGSKTYRGIFEKMSGFEDDIGNMEKLKEEIFKVDLI
jgi:hypothetical protein